MNILRNSICFLLIGFVCAQERSISGATSRRNRFSAGKPQAVNFNCPEDFGYYAHPTDCSQYYVCVFGGALLESCTGGLMYSTELQTCDWPRNVVCKASSGPGVSTVKITDPRTRSTDTNSIHSATESLSSSSIVSRGVDNTIRNTQPLKSSGISKAIFEDPSEGRQGRFVTIQEDPHQRIDNGFQAQETSSRAFNVVPSAAATPNSKLTFPWKSDMKRKSRRRRDLNRGRQFDSSSSAPEKLLSLFDVSSFKNPFDISFSSSALLSAGPRERTNREIRKKKTVLPPEASFISSSFVNPFKPRHQRRGPFRHYEQIPNVSFRNQHSQFDNDKKRNSFGSHFPPQGPPMPTFKNQLTSKVHTQKRPIYPDKRHREQEFHPPMSFPVHLQRDRFRSSGGSGPNESPKSIGTSNFAIDFHRPDLPELKNSPFSNNFKNFKQDFDSHFYRDDDFENDDKSQYQDEYYDVSPNDNDRPFQHNEQVNSHPNTYTSNDHLSNSQRDFYEDYGDRTHEKNPHFNRHTNDFNNDNNDRPNFKPLPVLHPTHDTEEYQNYDYVEQDHLKLTPPVVEDAVLLTPTEDYQELQNISEEKDQIEGKHIEGDFSPNHLEDFPPNHLEDFSPNHLIANNQINTPRTKTRRKPSTKTIKSPRPSLTTPEPQPEPTPFQTTPQPPSTLPSRMPVPKFGQKTFKKQTLRRPPQIPGTARHPELSKLNVKHDDSPSLPGQSRFPSVRSSTTSPKSDNLYADILNSNDTDYYYYYDDILYDDYYDQTAKKTTTKAPVVRSSSRGTSRNKPKAPSKSSPQPGAKPQLVGRTPQRPNPLYPQPQVDLPAAPCDPTICKLPDCYCGGKAIPGNIPVTSVPQLVLLTFDDAVNDLNKELYRDLFERGRVNPNGCPIAATFYVSHEWTDYTQVQNLYSDGHEIASHSITHSFGEQFSTTKWAKEIGGQREIMSAYGGVRMEDIRGMRAPFLAVGGNNMFRMLYDLNFTYDSSMPVYENNPPSWPYTLDYKIFHDCMIPPCPTHSFPGVWQVPMVMWQDLTGGRCSMGDACTTPPDAEGVYKMLIKNFERHYTTNRSPFGLFYHAAWFTTPHHKEGFIAFLDTIAAMDDVWLVTNWQALQWVRDPTPLSTVKSFAPLQCDYPERPPRCTTPKVCNVWHKGSVRYMKTCQSCPESYPWTGSTGVPSPLNNI